MANRWGNNGNSETLFSWAPKSLQVATAAMKLRHLLLGRKTMTNLVTILKSRDITLPTKVQLVKAMFFSNSHVWMWELDHKKGWVPKNWCFWTVVLEKTLESPLDCKEIKPVNPKANQPWIYIGRTDAATEASILWSPDAKSHLIRKDPDSRKDWRQEEKGTQKTRRHHWFNGHEFEQALGVGDGQGSMSCCGPRGRVGQDWATKQQQHYPPQRHALPQL